MTAVQERERYRIACILISIGRSKRGTHEIMKGQTVQQ